MVDKWKGINKQIKGEKKRNKTELKVSYTNADGILSKRLECLDYLKRERPDIMCIVETKLTPNIELSWFDNGQYNIWREDRISKKGGGLLVLTRRDLEVKEVNLSSAGEEVISLIIADGKKDINIITAYVPPKTSAWENEQYLTMKTNTLERMKEEIVKKDKVVLMGDFNCKGVVWENYEVTDGNEWGEEMLNMMMDNLMTQWVKETTRCRGEDDPARLDLVFTRGLYLRKDIEHECPLGKSDHNILEFELDLNIDSTQTNKDDEGRLNYNKANYHNLREFFRGIDWSEMYYETDTQLKYDKFMKVYNDAVHKFVPAYGKKQSRENHWFNISCEDLRKKKEKAWRKLRRRNEPMAREEYITARNNYVEVRRKAQKEYEERIVENCESNPKMFYKFINGKLNKKEVIEKVKVGEDICEDMKNIVEILNENFCKVFTKETDFTGKEEEEEERANPVNEMQSIVVTKGDIENI